LSIVSEVSTSSSPESLKRFEANDTMDKKTGDAAEVEYRPADFNQWALFRSPQRLNKWRFERI
jgi:hypothetical protein